MSLTGLDVPFIDVGVEYLVDEANRGRLVGILVWQFDMNLPFSFRKRCYRQRSRVSPRPLQVGSVHHLSWKSVLLLSVGPLKIT